MVRYGRGVYGQDLAHKKNGGGGLSQIPPGREVGQDGYRARRTTERCDP